ncbi:PREDICTED: APOBEC1 complementation factor-like [Thamnophis sirtalis]|uniref:APOBEC1 complementation factor-like n=1 Tax=Thamnophis sirtalis TaxID=35019 RepID=A0A6I9XWV6_9SAUR|nr:PREDICTED: APOBEC1 complementation factor-like [Thamnophis sirtalis]
MLKFYAIQKFCFSFIKENGQRKYGGPPPDWNGPPPERGCEIFVGKLPRDLFEDELIPLCEKVINQQYLLQYHKSSLPMQLFIKNVLISFHKDAITFYIYLHSNYIAGRIQLWGHPIAVDWAEPEVEVDEDTMSSVKILYVRNLMLTTAEETIEKEFNHIKPGKKNIRDGISYIFHVFSSVFKVLDGSPIEVTLAKPVDKDSYVRYTRGTGGRAAALPEFTYTFGHVYDPATAYLGAPVFYAPQAYAAIPGFHFPAAKGHLINRGIIRPSTIRGNC